MTASLYAKKQRKPWTLEPHYSAHVRAMTEEDLHHKADIAAELAFRDKQIEELRAALVVARSVFWMAAKYAERNSVNMELYIAAEEFSRDALEPKP